MEKAAFYHRPESEYAYPLNEDEVQLRVRTKKDDVKKVSIIWGDPYDYRDDEWQYQESVMHRQCQTQLFDYWEINLKLINRRIQYIFRMQDDHDDILYTDRQVLEYSPEMLKKVQYFKLPYLHQSEIIKKPKWIDNTVWYQIFPERFANGDPKRNPKYVKMWDSKYAPKRDDFFGGDLQGVIDHLDYLQDLGINGLYFCPIFESPTNHKYNTVDYFKVDQHFGDDETLHKLITEAHRRGMKVMLDAVFNHIGTDSVQWQDVLENGKKSKYYDWFHIYQEDIPEYLDESGQFNIQEKVPYDTFAYVGFMPKLNTGNLAVRNHLISIAKYWIEKFDIDAWRLDVANEVSHDFWREFAKACHQSKKDFYILGEVWNSAQSWLQGDQFSGSMNYPYTDAIKQAFIDHQITGQQMINELNKQLMLYRDPINKMMLNVLDSHDTPRILNQCHENKDLMKQVMAFTFLQTGMPCVYYGDEVGLTGAGDPDNRRVMEWNPNKQDQDLHEFFKQLIALRHDLHRQITDGVLESVDDKVLKAVISKKYVAYFNLCEEDMLVKNGPVVLSNNFNNGVLQENGFVIMKRG